MTAPKHGNRPDSQVQRARGGSPQRIFLNSGTIVDRPPVLFRMPSVAQNDTTPDAATKAAAAQQPLENAASAPQASAADEQIVMVDPPAMVVQQPHASQPHAAKTPASGSTFIADEVGGSAPVAINAGADEDLRGEQDRREEHRRESAKPRVVESSPLAAVPAGRSWMESYGSRLIPVLLIVAVAAYALLVNKGADSDPDLTLADFDINVGETKDAEGAISPANDPLANPSLSQLNGKPISGSQAKAEQPGNIALAPPANDPQAAEWGANSQVSEVKPDFDLAELMGSPAVEDPAVAGMSAGGMSAGGMSAGRMSAERAQPVVSPAEQIVADNTAGSQFNASGPRVNEQPDWQRDLAAAGVAAGIREPAADIVNTRDGVIREQGGESGGASTGQLDSSPIRDNQWVKLDRREQTARLEQQLADARRQLEAYRPNSEPTALLAEDAIQAAVDAAVGGQFTNSGDPPVAPSYRMSNQPAGIPDWSRYLPPAQDPSNRGSLIQGMQPNDANPAAVPPGFPGPYPGHYPEATYGNPGAPQQAYGMPTGYPQQPPATR